MKRFLMLVMILILSNSFVYSQNPIKIQETATLDSSSSNVILGRQSIVIDSSGVIHLFYAVLGQTADSIFEFTSDNNGITWNGRESISTYKHSSSYTREHIRQISATVDNNNDIHIIYEYTGPPNYISGWDDYPSSHVSYVAKVDGNWTTSENVINDEDIQSREGNGSTVSYLDDCQIINYNNAQYFISYDYAWWATKYHVVYSNNTSGNWATGDTLHTFNLGSYDHIILQAPSMIVNNDTLFALWYQRNNCTVEMKKFDGTNWSNAQTIFTDKYYPAATSQYTSYYVHTGSCQNNKNAAVAMVRNAADSYHELILLTKYENGNWQIDTTQMPEKYSYAELSIFMDTTYIYMYGNSSYTGSIVKFTKKDGFSNPIPITTEDTTGKLLNIRSLTDASLPFAYVVRDSKNVNYLKIGKINHLITDVKNTGTNLPDKFTLSQNYPNPFNPATTIEYSISETAIPSVQLKIYDVLGREVATLVNKRQVPGKYSVQFNAENLSSGIYLYKLSVGNFRIVKKMILLK